jgi:hypothetical protein
MSSHRYRGSAGKQPARVDVARKRSAIGDTASENWPINFKEMDALENLDNQRLGDLHGELRGAHEHYGAELKRYQDAIQEHRLARRLRRDALAAQHLEGREVDAALARDPDHMAVHRAELVCRVRARALNGILQQLLIAKEMLEEEMTGRIKARGFVTLPGHVHLFNSVTARYRRRKRVRLRKNQLRPVARGAR